MRVYTNNIGTKYLVSCPLSCGTCSADLKCDSCLDGEPVNNKGSCPVDVNCNGIPHCARCGGTGVCRWCKSKILLPLLDGSGGYICRNECPEGYGPAHKEDRFECLGCLSHKCKKCEPYDNCKECRESSQALLSHARRRGLPPGMTLVGQKDCFEKGDLKDWYYVDGNEFKLCKSGCKRCTNSNDCSACGDLNNPSNILYFLVGSTGTCLSSCELADNRFKVDHPTENRCLQCSAGEYYLGPSGGGSGDGTCDSCLATDSKYRDEATRRCFSCGIGCSRCTSAGTCDECSDINHFVQISGGECKPKCQDREMELSTNPKRCQRCPTNCQQCTETEGCKVCDQGFYRGPDPITGKGKCFSCPGQCSGCSSVTICQGCKDTSLFLNTDKLTCSENCLTGEYEDASTVYKKCEKCPQHCNSCSGPSTCTSCNSGYFLESGSCKVCPSSCSGCISSNECTGCQDPNLYLQTDKLTCSIGCNEKEYKDPTTRRCQNCPENCQSCDASGCIQCSTSFRLSESGDKCELDNVQTLDYILIEQHTERDPSSYNQGESWFYFLMVIEDSNELTDTVFEQIVSSFLKEKQELISVELSYTNKEKDNYSVSFEISVVEEKRNQLKILIKIVPKQDTSTPNQENKTKKFSIKFQSNSKHLDTKNQYLLKEKSTTFDLEDYPPETILENSALKPFTQATESTTNPLQQGSQYIGMISGFLLSDPNNAFTKLSQFITLLKRIRLIGCFLGTSLEEFLDRVSGEAVEKPTQSSQSASREGSNSTRRSLGDLKIGKSKDKNKERRMIKRGSNGSKNKLDRYRISIFYQGNLLLKTILYDLSWILKLVGLLIYKSMIAHSKVSKAKLNYIKYQRNIHSPILMATFLDLYFFGARILLHRRLDNPYAYVAKAISLFNMLLLTFDFLEILLTIFSINKKVRHFTTEFEFGTYSKKDCVEKDIKKVVDTNRNNDDDDESKNVFKNTKNEAKNKKKQLARGDLFPALSDYSQIEKELQKGEKISGMRNRKSKPLKQSEFMKKYGKPKMSRHQIPGSSTDRTKEVNNPMNRPTKLRFLNYRRGRRNSIWLKNLRNQSRGISNSSSNHLISNNDASVVIPKNGKRKYKVIDHQRTLRYHGIDKSIEEFCVVGLLLPIIENECGDSPVTSELKNKIQRQTKGEGKSKNDHFTKAGLETQRRVLFIALLYNLTEPIHQAILQVAIVSLPWSPSVLLVILLLIEILFPLMTLLPALLWFRYLSWMEVARKSIRFISLGGFLVASLIISSESNSQKKPVSEVLQKVAIWLLVFGIIGLNLTTIFKIWSLISVFIKSRRMKKTKMNQIGQKSLETIKEFDGLIYYKKPTQRVLQRKRTPFKFHYEEIDLELPDDQDPNGEDDDCWEGDSFAQLQSHRNKI